LLSENVMKIVNASFLFPLSLLVLSIPAFAGGPECAAATVAQKQAGRDRIDQDLKEVLDSIADRDRVQVELLQLAISVAEDSKLYHDAKGECLIQKRLEKEIADLRERARLYMLEVWEVQAMQREIVLARLERAILELKELYERGEIAEDAFKMGVATLHAQAFHWFETQGVVSIRVRLQEAVFALQQAAGNQIDAMHKAQQALFLVYEARFVAAMHTLRERITSGKAAKEDYLRLESLVRAFETLKKSFVPHEC
jgi:hypothetical protein